MNRISLALLLIVNASCRTAESLADPPSQQAKSIHITIVGTNDLHGWIYPVKMQLPSGVELQRGGLAVFAGYLAILRRENPDGVLLLDGGDLFQGTLVSNMSEGAIVIDAYNALGYQAAAIGNHEFDFGPVGPASTASRPDQDPVGTLKERIRQAKFPLLSANIFNQETQTRPEWLKNNGTTILQKNGIRVGILGLTTPSTPTTTNPTNVKALRFAPLAPEALQAAGRLRARGAELIVAVAHAGGKCTSLENPNDLSSCVTGPDAEIFELLKSIPTGTIDAVVAGHTHWPVGHFVNGTPVIETPGLGFSFAMIDLEVETEGHHVIRERTRISAIPICEYVDETTKTCDARVLRTRESVRLVPATFHGALVQRNSAIDAIIDPALRSVARLQLQPVGVSVPFPLSRNRDGESTLGDVLADAMRNAENADVAIHNSGGIRADFPSGNLTYGSVFETLPFDNTIATLKINGRQLRQLLDVAYGSKSGVFQISGLAVVLSKCPGPDRLKEARMADGRDIQDTQQYKVVLSDFLARGGDGLDRALSKFPAGSVDLGSDRKTMRDTLVDYWKKNGGPLVAPIQSRIVFADKDASCTEKARTHSN